ncbi:MAG: hypothetical protein ACI9V1_002171 [Spirosomataceae bacterium]|jgi:hypothetical protein
MRKVVSLLSLLFAVNTVNAQELLCTVDINTNQMQSQQTSNPQVTAELKSAITNFMNNTRWTNDIFAQEERIRCNLIFNVLESKNQNSFNGNVQFQVIRPIYGTDYETVVFQYVDRNFNINFAPEERQMVFNEQGYTSNLTSTLALYAMVALASDYDSFSELGGDEFVQRAYNIVNLAAPTAGPWVQGADRRSKYWIVENLQNQQLLPYRKGFYTYHRIIMDDFANNTPSKRGQVLAYLKELQDIQILNQKAVLIDFFMDAKARELVNIFSEAPESERKEAFNILSKMAPEKTELFRGLI